jgi:hypothetical protein
MSRLIAVPVLVAGAALLGVPATAQQAARACTAAELQRSEVVNGVLPYSVFEGSERVTGALRTKTLHHLEVTPAGNVIDSSIRASTSAGALPRVDGARPVTFALSTGGPGTIAVDVSWQQEVVDAQGVPTGDRCDASGTLKLTVRSPRPVRLTGKGVRTRFEVGVRPGPAPASRSRVIYELRVRRGRALPPTLRAKPVARFMYTVDTLGPVTRSDVRTISGVGQFLVVASGFSGPNARGRMLLVAGTVPRGEKRRFGFSIRVLQGGRTVGGLRGGAVCRGSTKASLRCAQTLLVNEA